jgi:hypothetical protein
MRSDKQASPFLFASPDRRAPSSARRVHLRRLCDILHLSIQRGDLLLARSAFGLLARCEDVEWAAIWKFGLSILAADADDPPGDDVLGTPRHIEFLQVMMLRYPEQVRASLFFSTLGGEVCRRPHRSIAARIARAGAGAITSDGRTGARRPRRTRAVRIPNFYSSFLLKNPTRAMQLPSVTSVPRQLRAAYVRGPPLSATGTICDGCQRQPKHPRRVETASSIAVETSSSRNTGKSGDVSEQTLLREAQQHLERARALDPEGVVAQVFIRRVRPPS